MTKQPITPSNKRSRVVPFKVSDTEYRRIKQTADKCGLTVSEYVRLRSLGYAPKARLTKHETQLLETLLSCRADMVNYANALSGLCNDEKLRLFHNREFMLDWYGEVAKVTNDVTAFIAAVNSRGGSKAGTTNNGKTE